MSMLMLTNHALGNLPAKVTVLVPLTALDALENVWLVNVSAYHNSLLYRVTLTVTMIKLA